MTEKRIKVYTYTRVSTAMQIDGYSLDAQKARMKAFADFNGYEIAREYEDAGKSGRSIEGRLQFQQMMKDIRDDRDGVSYVLVYKLSRFGRNAADVLNSLQIMQDFGVNLICVEDGIDSSKDAGKLIISVLSAVAEIEKDNIRVQTMEGRMQKAREGRWNGGPAPYGYQLKDGELIINEEEAKAVRVIYDKYVHTDLGANGIARYLAVHGIDKIPRQNGTNIQFDAHYLRRLIKNPVYCGKIAFGRIKSEKVRGTRNEYRHVEAENYILVDGLHEGIVSEELWQAAQVKAKKQAKRYEHVFGKEDQRIHVLSSILRCPVCGAPMYGYKCKKRKPDGTRYKDYYYYGCKHRLMTRGGKCSYRKMVHEETIENAVAEVISQLVSRPKFAAMMTDRINTKIDTTEINQEISTAEKALRHSFTLKAKLIEEIDSLDFDDRHYNKRKADLDERLYGLYDKIDRIEAELAAARDKKSVLEAEKMTAENIYRILINFRHFYDIMDRKERKELMEALISEIQIHEEAKPTGQWLKSIRFRLPIIPEDMSISLDNGNGVECVVLLSKGNMSTKHIRVEFDLENLDTSGLQTGATYDEIREWIQEKYGFHVSRLNIAQIKRKHGLDMRENYNLPKSKDSRQPNCPEEKEKAIEEALKHFKMI
ncbi:MAG: recombinase family protein [Lachnospiraceae bacterium]|nr:recombinase family protein [Lachnospiraceae bacterium]